MARHISRVDDLDTPAILIDQTTLQSNIRAMQELANSCKVTLRPHIKTHKSVELARRQLEAGARGIAVATVGEAEVMAAHGIYDIQIANQVVGRTKIERLARLARTAKLCCAVDSVDQVKHLGKVFAAHNLTIGLFVEIDTGLHRGGLAPGDDVFPLVRVIERQPGVSFEGLMTHAGHVYGAESPRQVAEIGRHEGQTVAAIAEKLRGEGVEVRTVSVGSTPTAQFAARVPGVTELRIGNYLFNDGIQVALGVARHDQCALTVLATVTSVHPERVVIDAGSKSLSSDSGAHGSRLVAGFGRIVGSQWTVSRLSEEHGVIEVDSTHRFSLGDRVRVVPNHACPVMNLAEFAWLVEADGSARRIEIDARRR